jgi:protein-L-isoaspartate(D-aspartate) O-methyltransferase
MTQDEFAAQRSAMVAEQIEPRGLHNPRLLDALRNVPRHRFIPEKYREMAYDDGPLPIGNNQTISQPYIVALMTDLLELSGAETVLEIGTGSGYQAGVLSRLANFVHTIERHAELAGRAASVLAELGYANVAVHTEDGSLGWAEAAPYPAILVTAAAPAPPPPLLAQLAEGGRLVLPAGSRFGQNLQVWRRHGEQFERRSVVPVAFVPLRGEYGWSEQDWDGK